MQIYLLLVYWKDMQQKNQHFLFGQTYFGAFEDEEEIDGEEEISAVPWVLILEPNEMQQKIGLFLHWME